MEKSLKTGIQMGGDRGQCRGRLGTGGGCLEREEKVSIRK